MKTIKTMLYIYAQSERPDLPKLRGVSVPESLEIGDWVRYEREKWAGGYNHQRRLRFFRKNIEVLYIPDEKATYTHPSGRLKRITAN